MATATKRLEKKCNYLQLMYKIESDFVPGRPGTEEFVPGHLHLSLSRDKLTPGQGKCPCPGTKGQRDKLKILPRDGTGRDFDRLSRPGTSRGTEVKEKVFKKGDFFL